MIYSISVMCDILCFECIMSSALPLCIDRRPYSLSSTVSHILSYMAEDTVLPGIHAGVLRTKGQVSSYPITGWRYRGALPMWTSVVQIRANRVSGAIYMHIIYLY